MNVTQSQVFGLWVGTRVPGENRRKHKERMQTPRRKTQGPTWGLNPGPSLYKASVLVSYLFSKLYLYQKDKK